MFLVFLGFRERLEELDLLDLLEEVPALVGMLERWLEERLLVAVLELFDMLV